MEDTRKIRDDEGLTEILALENFPSSDATGDWLRRVGSHSGLEGLEKVNKRSLMRGMRYDGIKGYTLDIDATRILAEKELAKMTYKGFKGYIPIVGHLAENGLVLADEFREGNDMGFAIGADLDEAVLGAIRAIPKEPWKPYKNGYIAETVHSMNKTKKAFRLIVIRRPYQGNMFTGNTLAF